MLEGLPNNVQEEFAAAPALAPIMADEAAQGGQEMEPEPFRAITHAAEALEISHPALGECLGRIQAAAQGFPPPPPLLPSHAQADGIRLALWSGNQTAPR